jgi:hypothetical protein
VADLAAGEERSPADGAIARLVGERAVVVERAAVGTVITTGDKNNVRVTIVVADKRLIAQLQAPVQTAVLINNPYRGLDAFYETNAEFFFGRRKLTRRAWLLFQRLQHGFGPRILAIVGGSGSGKSSLARAGLLPELAREPMEGLTSPQVLVLRPGAAPLVRLTEVLSCLPDVDQTLLLNLTRESFDGQCQTLHQILAGVTSPNRSRFVIVVDQYEELFTECTDSAARRVFLENLAHAASDADHLVTIVLTLRNDFVGAVQAPDAFASTVRENRLVVQAMDRDELTDAIATPAQKLGIPWPTGLVENLVGQAEGRAGALPLLQFALRQLWPDHAAGRLDEGYWSSRLIEDFLVQTADAAFENAGTEKSRRREQRIIRRAFLAMVQLGEGTPDTRRIARLSELVASDEQPDVVQRVLASFTAPEARLVTASEQGGEPTYELTHEALITSWNLLRSWLGGGAGQGGE